MLHQLLLHCPLPASAAPCNPLLQLLLDAGVCNKSSVCPTLRPIQPVCFPNTFVCFAPVLTLALVHCRCNVCTTTLLIWRTSSRPVSSALFVYHLLFFATCFGHFWCTGSSSCSRVSALVQRGAGSSSTSDFRLHVTFPPATIMR